MSPENRMKQAINDIVANVNELAGNTRLVFERDKHPLRGGWIICDNQTGEETIGTLAEIYAECRTIGEAAAFAHLASQQAGKTVV